MKFYKLSLLFTVVAVSVLMGEARIKYLNKDADMEFIGKKEGYERITVPKEIVEYEPTLTAIENSILYEQRVNTKAECIADNHNHEYCPIDKAPCQGQMEYTQGTSVKNEALMTCSYLNPDSYYDTSRSKCVLPPDKALVCQEYEHAFYRASDDVCVVPDRYDAIKIGAMATIVYDTKAKWENEESNNLFLNALRTVVLEAGGTYVNRQSVDVGGFITQKNVDWRYTFNNTKPFWIKSDGYPWIKVNPGDYIERRKAAINALTNDAFYYFVMPANGNYNAVMRYRASTVTISSYNNDFNTQLVTSASSFNYTGFLSKLTEATIAAGGTSVTNTQTLLSSFGGNKRYRQNYYMDNTQNIYMNVNNAPWINLECPTSTDTFAYSYANEFKCQYIPDNSTWTTDLDNWFAIWDPLAPTDNLYLIPDTLVTGTWLKTYAPAMNFSERTDITILDTSRSTGLLAGTLNINFHVPSTGIVPNGGWCLDYDYVNGEPVCNDYDHCKPGYTKMEENGVQYCYRETTQPPHCKDAIFTQRDQDECMTDQKKYIYYTYECPDDLNIYDYAWEPINPGGDCGESSLISDTDGDGIKDVCNSPVSPNNNCERVNYKCSIDEGLTCVQEEGEKVTTIEKRPLPNPSVSGGYKIHEYGNLIKARSTLGNTRAISTITGSGNNLCFEDKAGTKGCFSFTDGCEFNGTIKDTLINEKPLLSFLNSPEEDIPEFNSAIHEDHESPTGIAIKFDATVDSGYPLPQVKEVIQDGDKVTVKLWINWDGLSEGSVFSFGDYGLWITTNEDGEKVFGFNDIDGNIRGFTVGAAATGWYEVLAEFTQGSIADNIIEVNGKQMPLQTYVVRGLGTFSGAYEISTSESNKWILGEWGANVYFPIDINTTYTLGATMEINGYQGDTVYGDNKPLQYFGVRNFDIDQKNITSINWLRWPGATDTRLSRNLNPGDTKMYLKDATGWDNGPGQIDRLGQHTSHRFIWYGYTNSKGYTYPDYTYTRNNSGYDTWDEGAIKDLGGEWEITLTKGWWGPAIAAGTAVRNGRNGISDTWALWQAEIVRDGTYPRTNVFGGGTNTAEENDPTKFMPGVAYIRPLLLANWWQKLTTPLAPPPTVTLKDIYMANSSLGTVAKQNLTSNIAQPIYLSGNREGGDGAFVGKLAGINVYDGTLTAEQKIRDFNGGIPGGVLNLDVEKNKLIGYDYFGTNLGQIYSTCKLSGKIGFKPMPDSATNEVPPFQKEVYSEDFNTGATGWTNGITVTLGELGTFMGRYPGTGGAEGVFKTFDYGTENAGKNVEINMDLIKLDSWEDDERVIVFLHGKRAWAGDRYIFMQGTNFKNVSNETNGGYKTGDEPEGFEYKIHIKLFTLLDEHGQLRIGFGSNLNQEIKDESFGIDNVTIDLTNAPNPITSAVVDDNRIEFWNSYEEKGSSGYLEIMKQVPARDVDDGYVHEFPDLVKLYNSGFTGFKSYENNSTYAISEGKMEIGTCQGLLQGTKYFLAGRSTDDPIGNAAITALSRYMSGNFEDYCIIQKNNKEDNQDAQFSVKQSTITGMEDKFYCSQWTCEAHQCGVASCKEGFDGTLIKEGDRDKVLNSTICISQDCDINLDYFAVCGAMIGCPDTIGVYQNEDKSCVKATCEEGDTLNIETGKCEKMGCKDSIDAGDGTCYKLL